MPLSLNATASTPRPARRASWAVASVVAVSLLAGCSAQEELTHGYVISDATIAQVQVGSSKEQVLLVLGSPSTTSTIGGETFYYISQRRQRMAAFLHSSVTDQRVVAVYFDDKGLVSQMANYGLQDGKVFDFISRTTRTGGADYGLLTQILRAGVGLGR